MPSPFPGMDPFLEQPSLFPGLHNRLVAVMSEMIQANLPEPYYAEIGERIWVEIAQRYIEPDVHVSKHDLAKGDGSRSPNGSAVATAIRTQPVVIHVPQDERHEPWLGIYTGRGSEERLVTSLEVLSLSNKTPGEKGRDLYLRKQRELLDGPTNLVEIDLLRGGEHTTAVPLKLALERAGAFDYHVSIHQFDKREDYFIYPILLSDTLPEIAIPLLPGDGSIALDLQIAFNRCYDTGPYRRRVRYSDNVLPPLKMEQAAWVRELLAGKGFI